MIIYEPGGNWLEVVFIYAGSVLPAIQRPFLLWAAIALAFYAYVEVWKPAVNQGGHNVLGSTMSFLLIFRANQAYARYWQGRTCMSVFFSMLRDFTMMSTLHMHGGAHTMAWISGVPDLKGKVPEDIHDQKARECRVNLARYTIAYAVLFKLHTRVALDGYCMGTVDAETKWKIDWDRLRLRQLLTAEEFSAVDACLHIYNERHHAPKAQTLESLAAQFRNRTDGPPSNWPDEFDVDVVPHCRGHSVLLFYLSREIKGSVNDMTNCVPWGIKERFAPNLLSMLREAQKNFDTMSQIITTPIALPYSALCKTLCIIWMLSNTLTMDHALGFYGSYVTSVLIVFALLGIDAISAELENPFGDDPNDLDVLEHIHMLECETMDFLDQCGDSKARQRFVWRRVPEFVSCMSMKPIQRHIAVSAHATGEIVQSNSATPASSHRSSDRLLESVSSRE